MAIYLPGTAEDQALALDEMTPREIVERSMKIAAEICIYSNQSVTIEELKSE